MLCGDVVTPYYIEELVCKLFLRILREGVHPTFSVGEQQKSGASDSAGVFPGCQDLLEI